MAVVVVAEEEEEEEEEEQEAWGHKSKCPTTAFYLGWGHHGNKKNSTTTKLRKTVISEF